MEDTRIKEAEMALKDLGCGKVKLGTDFEIKKIEGNLFSKEFTRCKEGQDVSVFVAVAKSPYGAVIVGEDEGAQFLKFSVQLLRIVFSTNFNKSAIGLWVRTIRILKRKR